MFFVSHLSGCTLKTILYSVYLNEIQQIKRLLYLKNKLYYVDVVFSNKNR